MKHILGISGSLRRGSFNTALLRAARTSMPDGAQLTICAIADIPLYNHDVESSEGIPPAVEHLKHLIAESDGLLIATPEYNNSIPGVLKNAIDWLSRPPGDISRVFGGLPVALMGASPGAFGTTLSQAAWLPVLRTLGAQMWAGGRLLVPRARSAFDEDGALNDATLQERLAVFLRGFAEFSGRPSSD